MKDQEYIQRVGVGAIIRDETGRILLGCRNVDDNRGKWELLGGLLESAESLEDGIRREVAEEAGITIEPITIVAHYDRYFDDKNVRNVGFCFVCKHLSGEPHMTKHGRVSDFEWVEPRYVFDRDLTPYTKLQLEQYFEWLKVIKDI